MTKSIYSGGIGLLLTCAFLLSACTIPLPSEHEIRAKMRAAAAAASVAKEPTTSVDDIDATIEEPIAVTIPQPDVPMENLVGNLHLAQALASLPEGANHVTFIDWMLIREFEGFEDLTSESEEDVRWAFFYTLNEFHIPLYAFGWLKLPRHKEYWSFDSIDLAWEASISISRVPGRILKFRDGFDFTQLSDLFKEREYEQIDHHGITIFTKELDPRAEWRPYSELAIQNVAILPDENLLFLSSLNQNVIDMLDAHFDRSESLYDRPSVQPTLQSLGNAFGAFISADACDAFIKTRTMGRNLVYKWPQLEIQSELRPYETFGLAYRYEEADPFSPESVIVMQFPSPEDAQDDLAARSQLAEEGISWKESDMPYSDLYFNLADAYVDGDQIIMEVEPKDNLPWFLFRMASNLDMIFAICP